MNWAKLLCVHISVQQDWWNSIRIRVSRCVFPPHERLLQGRAELRYWAPSGAAANVISGSQSRPATCGGVCAWLPRRCAV